MVFIHKDMGARANADVQHHQDSGTLICISHNGYGYSGLLLVFQQMFFKQCCITKLCLLYEACTGIVCSTTWYLVIFTSFILKYVICIFMKIGFMNITISRLRNIYIHWGSSVVGLLTSCILFLSFLQMFTTVIWFVMFVDHTPFWLKRSKKEKKKLYSDQIVISDTNLFYS